MSKRLLHTLHCLWRGETMTRILMHEGLSRETLKGKVVDIGGGRNPAYFNYLQKDERGKTAVSIEALDASISGIDFEKDILPYQNSSIDTVLLCNVLEHVYNYRFLLGEILRIMKPSAQMIGFVPFWVGYHADPHDYFRYTDECLHRIFSEVGFKNIRIVRIGRGPLLGNFNTVVLSLPRFLRPILFLLYESADRIFVWLRPNSVKRNPLGYLFVAER